MLRKTTDKIIDGAMLAGWSVAYVNYVALSASVWAVGAPCFIYQKVKNG